MPSVLCNTLLHISPGIVHQDSPPVAATGSIICQLFKLSHRLLFIYLERICFRLLRFAKQLRTETKHANMVEHRMRVKAPCFSQLSGRMHNAYSDKIKRLFEEHAEAKLQDSTANTIIRLFCTFNLNPMTHTAK